jgi:hypothetical protein
MHTNIKKVSKQLLVPALNFSEALQDTVYFMGQYLG